MKKEEQEKALKKADKRMDRRPTLLVMVCWSVPLRKRIRGCKYEGV